MSKIRGTTEQDRVIQRRRPWGAIIAAVVIGGGLLTAAALAVPSLMRWSSVDQSVEAARLRYAEVERGAFVRDVSVQGRIVAAVRPTLYAPAAGTVSFAVAAGDTVTAGQVLATVDSPELASSLRQEEASLAGQSTELERRRIEARKQQLAQRKTLDNARVELTAAEREMRRAELAFEGSAISELDFEKARDDLERARLEFEHAEAEAALLADSLAFEIETQAAAVQRQQLLVDELERQVAELAVRSPVNGMVGNLAVDPRAYAADNQPLLTVIDLTALQVEVEIPESYADALALAMPAEIRWGQADHVGLLAAISPEVIGNQVIGRIRFAGQPPAGIRQNQRVSARIVLEEKDDTLFVRRGPFFDAGAGRIAYRVHDGVAERTSIIAGSTSVERIEILDGLAEGDLIVISSTSTFENAERVLLNQ
ncbi:MAG: HlyD family efflux transporter periplasmic adaptor subunit [Pseudomonadota bacterium]